MTTFPAFVKCAGCGEAFPVGNRHALARAKWCSERCRKAQYAFDPCVDCGAPTAFGPRNGRVDDPRCSACATEHRTFWTRERIIERIQEWHGIYGEPPAGPDWAPTRARYLNDQERAVRFEQADGYWPVVQTVIRAFGSWNAGIRAAGFESRSPHGGDGNESRRRNLRVAA